MNISAWKKRTRELRHIKAKTFKWCAEIDPQTRVHEGHDYDFESPSMGKIKIKQDRIAHVTKQYLFRPNDQIQTWLVVDNEFVSLVPAKHVKSGYVYREDVLKIPNVQTIQKWFQNK